MEEDIEKDYNDPEQSHKIFTELGFTLVEDGCDGFCPQCKQKLTCDLYDEFKDEWEALYRNNGSSPYRVGKNEPFLF